MLTIWDRVWTIHVQIISCKAQHSTVQHIQVDAPLFSMYYTGWLQHFVWLNLYINTPKEQIQNRI